MITNSDYIKSLPLKKLAKLSIYYTSEPDYDYDYDDNLYECRTYDTWHSVFTGDSYDSYDDAIEYTVKWLKAIRHDCSDCIFNDMDDQRVDNKCYLCSKGYEDNYIMKSE